MIKKLLHNLKSSISIGKEVVQVAKTRNKSNHDDLNLSQSIFNLIETNQVIFKQPNNLQDIA
jgi:hypothetical protein